MAQDIQLKAKDGHLLAATRVDPEWPRRGGIVLLQEVFGVNSHIRAVAERFANEGYKVIAPALFDRVERGISYGYTPEDVARGRQLRGKSSDMLAVLDVQAAIDAFDPEEQVATVGFCWGGTVAWMAAAQTTGLAAAVCYYGAQIPQSAALKPRCPVLLHFGERDHGIPLTAVDEVRAAHPEVACYVYDAGHGFSCDEREAYDESSAKLAWQRTLHFLEAEIG